MRLLALAALIALVGWVPAAWGQYEIVNSLPGTYVNISNPGNQLSFDGNDTVTQEVTLGNAVFPPGHIVIAKHGGVGFGALPPDTILPNDNEPLPSPNAFGGGRCALPYWDDIGDTTGGVYYKPFTNYYVVQWNEYPIGPPESGEWVTFQLQIFTNVGVDPPIYAQYLYDNIQTPAAGGGASATIGYQNGGARGNDVQWSYNTPGAVANGEVLSLIPEPSSLTSLAVVALLLRRRR